MAVAQLHRHRVLHIVGAKPSPASASHKRAVAHPHGRAPPSPAPSGAAPEPIPLRPGRYRVPMATTSRVTVSLDASIVAQAREQLGEPVAGLADGAVVERAVNAYLLRRMVDATQAAAGLSEQEAERVAYEELAASRRERRGGA